MSIDKKQIPSADFINNEFLTLGHIKKQSSVKKYFPELCDKAETLYCVFTGKSKKSPPTSFQFDCELKMEIEKRNRSLFIDVNVQENYSLATYALSICKDTEEKNLIRKFHFDYDPQVNSSAYKKPKYHLQYGGKATPSLEKNGISAKDLQVWLSVPRLSFTPINLALLLDIVFNEFPSEATQRVIEKPEWRRMIKNNEDTILRPYFENVSRFIMSDHNSNCLFREFVYGLQSPK